MANNSKHQQGRDRQLDRNEESDRSRLDNRQNTSGSGMENENTIDRSNERNDRNPTVVPDNYERDSE